MFDIGFLELLVIAVVSLLVLGPERLPGAVRQVGLWIGRIKRFSSQITREIDQQIKAEELRDRLKKEGDTLGVKDIQKTVNDALNEARQYEHLVEKGPLTETTPKPRATESEPKRERTTPDRTPD